MPQRQASKPQSERRVGAQLVLLSPPFRSTMPSFSLCPTLHELEPAPRRLPSLLTPTAKELNATQQPHLKKDDQGRFRCQLEQELRVSRGHAPPSTPETFPELVSNRPSAGLLSSERDCQLLVDLKLSLATF
ncbi:hypothetical protein KOW79_003045 [Hemibagrus wyckioides]|uniref:Uncharacterized protein n=1 Tax=Hemibagrus wyckioides TaxID=337641 RepID=A0A9D3P4J4_9TELE|nr:hypothetical protein KOW79_003045 [Hemibagrus wyckioides]